MNCAASEPSTSCTSGLPKLNNCWAIPALPPPPMIGPLPLEVMTGSAAVGSPPAVGMPAAAPRASSSATMLRTGRAVSSMTPISARAHSLRGGPRRSISDAQVLGDDRLHDLVGAAVDGLDAGVDEGARHAVFAHVAVPAVQLQAAVGGAHLQVGGPPLQPGGARGGQLTRQVFGQAVVEIGTGDVDFGCDLGQDELTVLEAGDR